MKEYENNEQKKKKDVIGIFQGSFLCSDFIKTNSCPFRIVPTMHNAAQDR